MEQIWAVSDMVDPYWSHPLIRGEHHQDRQPRHVQVARRLWGTPSKGQTTRKSDGLEFIS